MTNLDRAAKIIHDHHDNCLDAANALADEGLITPDLPDPYVVAGVDDAAVTAWQPCHTIVRTDIAGGAASEVEIPAGNVWIERDGLIGFDVNHGEMYLDTADARDLAYALLAAVDHAEGVGRA